MKPTIGAVVVRTNTRPFLAAVLLGLSAVGCILPIDHLFSLDFIQYWTAFRVAWQGLNPYEPMTLLAAQQALRPEATEPLMMWTGPWTLVILAPVLLLPFPLAVGTWALANVAMLVVCAQLIRRLLETPRTPAMSLALAAFFFPTWTCVALGQVSILVLLGALLTIHGTLGNLPVAFLAGVVLASVKPHLVLFLGLVLLTHLAWQTRVKEILWAPLVLVAAVAVSELMFPGLTRQWLQGLDAPGPGVVAPPSYMVTTLVGVVRRSLASASGMTPGWPMVVVPLVPTLAFAAWRLWSTADFDLARWWPGVLAVSYLCSPYGWTFDAVLLLPAYVGAMAVLLGVGRSALQVSLGAALIATQAAAWGLLWTRHRGLGHESFWWLPVLVFLTWLCSWTRIPRGDAMPPRHAPAQETR